MNEDMSKMVNDLSNILKEKNIDLNSVLGNLDTSSLKKETSSNNNTGHSNNSKYSNTATPHNNSSQPNNIDLNSLLSSFTNSNNNSNNNSQNNSNFDFSNLDIETILKLKQAMDSINSMDDSRSHLLLSLKPYLKNSRKNKVDQYIKILNLTKLIDIFGGDKK